MNIIEIGGDYFRADKILAIEVCPEENDDREFEVTVHFGRRKATYEFKTLILAEAFQVAAAKRWMDMMAPWRAHNQ